MCEGEREKERERGGRRDRGREIERKKEERLKVGKNHYFIKTSSDSGNAYSKYMASL